MNTTHNWIWMVTIVTVALTVTCATSMTIFKGGYEDDVNKMQNDQVDDDTKEVLIHKLLMKILSEEQEQGGTAFVDSLRDPDVKKAHLTKKINSMCHFKLCNLGRR